MTVIDCAIDITELELADPVPDLPPGLSRGGATRTQILLRLHDQPVGLLQPRIGRDGIRADELATEIWRAAGPTICAHLHADGIDAPDRLDPKGLGRGAEPMCAKRRKALIAQAPPITVLIATRDRTDSLMRCLGSVVRLSYPQFDVVVVDSAPSTDQTALAVQQLQRQPGYPPVHYVRAEWPGLAFAHNRGLNVVTGTWVAITDDDVTVDRHWLTGVLEGVSLDSNVACVTGPILPAEIQTRAQELLEQYGGFNRGFTQCCYDTGSRRPPDALFPFTTGRLGSGANMAYQSEFLREQGGFDLAMGAGTPARGGDDLLGFLQVLISGRMLAYQPSALLWHWHPREYVRLRRQAHGYGVGLGAYLTSAVTHDPSLLLPLARSVIPGARHFLARSSVKNAAKKSDFPRSLEVAELLGLVYGPLAYARSYHRYRRMQCSKI